MMAPTSPKRRKLDYSGGERVSPSEIPPQSDDETDAQSSSSEVSQDDVPNVQSKQPHTRSKRVQDDDSGALYAGGLYKSSMFKLQVDEMLAEVQPNYEKRAAMIDEALRRVKGLIEGIDGREALSVSCKYIVSNKPPSNTCVDTRGHEATAEIP
jgi:U3 small nucleolar RNA-associated protein 22